MSIHIPIPEKRIVDFEKLGFGLFIHWGLYSQIARGEWIQKTGGVPKEEYIKLKDTFTAAKFDAKYIARLAKKSGMKYIVLTTRHHEGFSLYDTKGLNEFDAVHSPAGRDLVAEFITACKEEGIVPFFYHTTLDWYQEDFINNFQAYQVYLRKSIEILCTNYGEIGGFWFDGNWSNKDADWEEDALYGLIRKYQPNAMIINNSGVSKLGEQGHHELDSLTFEQGRPTQINREGMEKYLAAEMCQTLNSHWGTSPNDINYQSTKELIETLCECRKVGANYLFNIGPNADGTISKIQEGVLEAFGQWTSYYGEAIYNTRVCNVKGTDRNFMLKDDNKYYIFVYDLSIQGDPNFIIKKTEEGYKKFFGFTDKVKAIKWMDNQEELDFKQQNDVLSVFCTNFPAGYNLIVRVAEVIL
jgi:alpha-L-fucosidase